MRSTTSSRRRAPARRGQSSGGDEVPSGTSSAAQPTDESSSNSNTGWAAVEATAREMDVTLEEALSLIANETSSETIEIEADFFAKRIAPQDNLLAAKCKLAYIRSRPEEDRSGRRLRLQTRKEQDELINQINKSKNMLHCKNADKGELAYVCVQYVLKAIMSHDLHYILGAMAVTMQRPQNVPAPKEFAGADLYESLEIKMARPANLYRGDLEIVAAYILAVFADESCEGNYKYELQSRRHDPANMIEYFVTIFRQSFEPDVNTESIIISLARDRIKSLYTFETRRWTIELAYLFIETTLQPLQALRSKKWEDMIMDEIAAMISLAPAQTEHSGYPAINQLYQELDRKYYHLGVTREDPGRKLCSPSALLRALAEITSTIASKIARAQDSRYDAGELARRSRDERRKERHPEERSHYDNVRAIDAEHGGSATKRHRFERSACYRCGYDGHIAQNCPGTRDGKAKDGGPLVPLREKGAGAVVRAVQNEHPSASSSDLVDQSVATFRAGIGDAVGDGLGEGDMAELTRLHRTAIRSLEDEVAKLREAAASGVAASGAFGGAGRGSGVSNGAGRNRRRGRGGGGRGGGGGNNERVESLQARQFLRETYSVFRPHQW